MARLTLRRVHILVSYVLALPFLTTVLTGTAYRISRNIFHADKSNVKWLLEWHQMSIIGLQRFYPILLSLLLLTMLVTSISMSYLSQWFHSILVFCHLRRPRSAMSNDLTALELCSRGSGSGSSSNTLHISKEDLVLDDDLHDENDFDAHPEDDDDGHDGEEEEEEDTSEFLQRHVPLHSQKLTCTDRLVQFARKTTWKSAHRCLGTILLVPLLITCITGGMYTFYKHWLYLDSREDLHIWMYLHEGRYLNETVYVTIIGLTTLNLTIAGIVLSLRRSGLMQYINRLRGRHTTQYSALPISAQSHPEEDLQRQENIKKSMVKVAQAFDVHDIYETEAETDNEDSKSSSTRGTNKVKSSNNMNNHANSAIPNGDGLNLTKKKSSSSSSLFRPDDLDLGIDISHHEDHDSI